MLYGTTHSRTLYTDSGGGACVQVKRGREEKREYIYKKLVNKILLKITNEGELFYGRIGTVIFKNICGEMLRFAN